ncbi:hypothetical protein K457DRAFT_140259 [Linnemannia elongata AG-77]|uniref:Uncharacterized protein n=1 Tax=Linnemannia elongata AG-77 TaxID=1314771 RepID=A0A197JMZ8_9FUNG|nr:hypothetical protein K457DRAFT_140259 [Linnemannia elongata AG-77]
MPTPPQSTVNCSQQCCFLLSPLSAFLLPLTYSSTPTYKYTFLRTRRYSRCLKRLG